jgi:hypothetical protein
MGNYFAPQLVLARRTRVAASVARTRLSLNPFPSLLSPVPFGHDIYRHWLRSLRKYILSGRSHLPGALHVCFTLRRPVDIPWARSSMRTRQLRTLGESLSSSSTHVRSDIADAIQDSDWPSRKGWRRARGREASPLETAHARSKPQDPDDRQTRRHGGCLTLSC